MDWVPPVLAAAALAGLAYSLLVVQRVLLGGIFVALLSALYLFYRFVVAFETIAESYERPE